ncbi:MAG: hypothetical protein Q8P59_00100, partial [Dehalococcoidia bacterium]|nr:hypothetical protein [Dehalococcoidia bacterium]
MFLLAILGKGGNPALAGEDAWTSTGGPPGLVYAVVLDPLTKGVLYIGTATAGVFKSTDSGQSWVSMNQGLGTKAVFSLALDPAHPNTLYAGTNLGVYRSEDGALSWSDASSGILRDPFGSAYVYTLVVDPRQPSTLYAGTLMGVFKSQDRGLTWQEKNTGLRIGLRPAVGALAQRRA